MKQKPASPVSEYLASATAAAAVRTASLRFAFRLSEPQAQDVQQTLLLGLLQRQPVFDREKGTVNTFTGAVSANLAADIANDLSRERRVFGVRPDWQEGANDPDFNVGLEGATEFNESATPLWAEAEDRLAEADLCYDIAVAHRYMSGEQRDLSDLLALHQDLPSACQASGMSSATFYRRVADLQMHLRMFGFKAAA